MSRLLTSCAVGSLLFLTIPSKAQREERDFSSPTSNASQIYFELLGPSIIYSFTYDGRLSHREDGLGFRIGIGGGGVNGDGFFTVPFQLNYLVGVRGKYLELGAGATYGYNVDFFDQGDYNKSNSNYTYGTMTIAFRKQPVGRMGFTYRIAFSPIFSFANGGSFLPYVGFSWGFRF